MNKAFAALTVGREDILSSRTTNLNKLVRPATVSLPAPHPSRRRHSFVSPMSPDWCHLRRGLCISPGQDHVSAEVETVTRLTPEERRRVRIAQQRAQQSLLEQLNAAPPVLTTDEHRGRSWLIKVVAIAALLGGALLASQALEFKAPASLVEALLPRL